MGPLEQEIQAIMREHMLVSDTGLRRIVEGRFEPKDDHEVLGIAMHSLYGMAEAVLRIAQEIDNQAAA